MGNGLLLVEERNKKEMKIVREKINEERIKSVKLREIAFDMKDYNQQIEIRKEQQKHYDKFLFFKNLSKAMNKIN